MTDNAETHSFQAEVSQVLHLVINSLYSNKEIFLRELISNASDALDKRRYRALTDPALRSDDPLEIRVSADGVAHTVTIADNGVGMTHDELVKNLGTVAHSGSRAFLEALADASGGKPQLIGQFGVGFYSAFLVADRVEVLTRPAEGDERGWRWVSDGRDGFTVAPAERATCGTTITLHLKEDQQALASPWRLSSLISRYSDYVGYPILLEEEKYAPPVEGEEPKVDKAWRQVNKGTALWQRAKAEISDEDYNEFYKHLTHDWDAPLARTHFTIEGRQLFTSVLFVPGKAPFNLYSTDQQHGVRLYVKRVFIMDDCKELLPGFLRFVRGVVDSDDLPLNVSRELLQDSVIVQSIRKHLTKRTFDLLDETAKDKPEIYGTIWEQFGAVLKEGLHASPEHKERLAPLLRFKSTRDKDGWVSLAEYKARMPEGQKAIYYVIGDTLAAAAASPHLEALDKRGYETLLLTDPIDEWAIGALETFDELPLTSAMGAELDIADAAPEADAAEEAATAELQTLIERFKGVLGDRVADVKASKRLTTSAACLVVPEGGHHAHMERLLKATQPGYAGGKRILELNGDHALVKDLEALAAAGESPELAEWIEVVFAQAGLAEGILPAEPSRFVQSVTRLLTEAAHGKATKAKAKAKSTKAPAGDAPPA